MGRPFCQNIQRMDKMFDGSQFVETVDAEPHSGGIELQVSYPRAPTTFLLGVRSALLEAKIPRPWGGVLENISQWLEYSYVRTQLTPNRGIKSATADS